MNEDFYNSIPPQIRRNPTLLAAYLTQMQMGQMQNLSDMQIPTSTTMNYADTVGLGGTGNMPDQNVVQQTTAPTNTISLTDDQIVNAQNTATNPEVFTDPATQEAMRQNRQRAQEATGTGNFQFFNPYMGVDIPTASYMFGQSIGEGNTGMAIATGLKTGLGLGRNILSGLGYAKQREKLMDEYYENQRRTVTQENNPTYYQDGGQQLPQDSQPQPQQGEQQVQQILQAIAGALSQGINPSEILQELVAMGIPEQEASQMIEFVMQQMNQQQQVSSQQPQQPAQQEPMMKDGGVYLDRLKGKKIKSYKYNEKTGNYEVEIE